MSKIQERLEALQPYVISMRFFQGKIPLIDVIFKDGWVVPDSEIITKETGNEPNYYLFFSDKEGIGIDELLDYAETIITLNIEKEKKNELLNIKVKELQRLFIDNSLSKLQQMKFVLGGVINSNGELKIDEITIDDEIVTEQPKVEVKVKPKVQPIKNVTSKTGTKVELPPKKDDGKVVLDKNEIPTEYTEGDCECGDDEACLKCMNKK